MTQHDMFNDYDENGVRLNINGNRTTRTEDNTIVYNLRFRYGDKIAFYSDQQILNTYDQFAGSEDFGDDDVWFENWLPNGVLQ